MPERRPPATRQGASRPLPYACEDEAREALLVAANAVVESAPGSARLSLRWNRSGAAGLLMSPASGQLAGLDNIAWIPLQECGADDATNESRLHRDIFLHREDVRAIVRGRFTFSTTLACFEAIRLQGIPAFHPDVGAAGGDSIRCAAGALGSPAASERVMAALDSRKACLLADWGVLATGATLVGAVDLARQVESLAQVYWHVLQLQPGQLQRVAS